MEKIHLISTSRLAVEKGFDLILELIKDVCSAGRKDKVSIDVFGDGPMREDLLKSIASLDFVTYHGRVPKKKLFETRKRCDYTLMPSKFLETFGLGALDSLVLGVPVIGYKKGGLQQFAQGILHIEECVPLFPIIQKLIYTHSPSEYDMLSKKCKKIASYYTRSNWKNNVEEVFGDSIKSRHFVHISDYGDDIGGIESYIGLVSKNLETRGVDVSIYTGQGGSSWRKKRLGLLGTWCNIWDCCGILSKIYYVTPDVLWRHSVQRIFGPLPLFLVGAYIHVFRMSTQQWLMTHDFGLYHPFPSRVYGQEQIYHACSLVGRTKEGWRCVGGRWMKTLRTVPLLLKYISSLFIKSCIQRYVDVVLVPSEYMKQILCHIYNDKVRIEVLPHVI